MREGWYFGPGSQLARLFAKVAYSNGHIALGIFAALNCLAPHLQDPRPGCRTDCSSIQCFVPSLAPGQHLCSNEYPEC